jgi:hypothetical protein
MAVDASTFEAVQRLSKPIQHPHRKIFVIQRTLEAHDVAKQKYVKRKMELLQGRII